MNGLQARHLVWSAGKTRIIDDISVTATPGEVLGLLGPNGSGKSSLLGLLAGLQRPHEGVVELDGVPLHAIPRRQLATRLAIVEQSPEIHTDITVEEAVALGRTPYRGAFALPSLQDREAISSALRLTGMSTYRSRSWSSLSGGEKQRVQIARALAQEPDVLLLDEPTNHLDIGYQLEILALLSSLGATVVTALHDLNLAARFCDAVAVLSAGRLVTTGHPSEVLTQELLRSVYRVEAVVEHSPLTSAPVATYLHHLEHTETD